MIGKSVIKIDLSSSSERVTCFWIVFVFLLLAFLLLTSDFWRLTSCLLFAMFVTM
jgi:hypothetical protein